jgi:hypothetical protein
MGISSAACGARERLPLFFSNLFFSCVAERRYLLLYVFPFSRFALSYVGFGFCLLRSVVHCRNSLIGLTGKHGVTYEFIVLWLSSVLFLFRCFRCNYRQFYAFLVLVLWRCYVAVIAFMTSRRASHSSPPGMVATPDHVAIRVPCFVHILSYISGYY